MEISIIVPVYNGEKYIHRCLEAIQNQSMNDFEVLIINDGSVDDTQRICEDFIALDSRFKLFNKANGGLSSARNLGISYAKGQYIGFVDGDDFIDQDMFLVLYETITRTKSQIACCRLHRVQKDSSFDLTTGIDSDEVVVDGITLTRYLLTNKIDSSACTKLFLSKVIKNESFPLRRKNEDFQLFVELFPRLYRCVYVPSVKYNYYLREESITTQVTDTSYVDHLLENSENMLNFIERNYPQLMCEAKSYNYIQVYNYLYFITSNNLINTNINKYHELKYLLRFNLIQILRCKYMRINDKIKIALLAVNPKNGVRVIRIVGK